MDSVDREKPKEALMTVVQAYDYEGTDRVVELLNAIHRAKQVKGPAIIETSTGSILTIDEALAAVEFTQKLLDF